MDGRSSSKGDVASGNGVTVVERNFHDWSRSVEKVVLLVLDRDLQVAD